MFCACVEDAIAARKYNFQVVSACQQYFVRPFYVCVESAVTASKFENYLIFVRGGGNYPDNSYFEKNTLKKIVMISLAVCAVGFIAYQLFTAPSGKSLSVVQSKIKMSAVTTGIFEDFIPVRGRVIPAKTLYLDATK